MTKGVCKRCKRDTDRIPNLPSTAGMIGPQGYLSSCYWARLNSCLITGQANKAADSHVNCISFASHDPDASRESAQQTTLEESSSRFLWTYIGYHRIVSSTNCLTQHLPTESVSWSRVQVPALWESCGSWGGDLWPPQPPVPASIIQGHKPSQITCQNYHIEKL